MPIAELFQFLYCAECDDIVSYSVGEHKGKQAAQNVRCDKCRAVVMTFCDDGESICCGKCAHIVPCLIDHSSVHNHGQQVRQIGCPECKATIVTFYRTPPHERAN
jgi:hypothetical protein